MPDQNQTDPNQTTPVIDPGDLSSTTTTTIQTPTEADVPPMPSPFSMPNTLAPITATTDSTQIPDSSPQIPIGAGSAAPSDDSGMTAGSPKKKFGTGKIIATILGIFVLIGGVAGGVILTQQNQNIAEQAKVRSIRDIGDPNARKAAQQLLDDNPTMSVTSAIQIATGKQDEVQKFADACSGIGDPVNRQACRHGGGKQDFNCPDGTLHCGAADGACRSSNECIAIGAAKLDNNGCNGTFDCVGVGNCKDYTGGPGKCFVNTQIGADPRGDAVCDGAHWTTCEAGYTCAGNDCIGATVNTPSGESVTTTTEATPSPTASCQNIKAYSSTWTLLTPAQLSTLAPATSINFCTVGVASEGTFDKGKFTINGIAQTETTTKRPGSEDFCQSYTVPAATKTFNVSAQIHHVTLGWK